MKFFHLLPGITLAVAISFCTPAFVQADATQRWSGTSTITFAGTSTLHDWSGKVAAEPFAALVAVGEDNQPDTLKAAVQVKVSGMDTDEPKRDENMRKAMRMVDFPLVTARMDTPFARILSGKVPVALPFQLELMGKTHDVSGVISNWKLADEEATFDLDFDLSMKKCGITVPSVLLVIRVGDVVKLHAQVKLSRKKA
jgi:hypothetical protein